MCCCCICSGRVPVLEDDMDLIDQVVAGAVALGEQLMQREVVPS